MIRKAKPQDIPALVELAVESLTTVSPTDFRIDKDSIKAALEIGLNPAHFLWVSEIDGEVVGAVGATVGKSEWFFGLECAVQLHYSRKPGEWIKLMRQFSKWFQSRSGIKQVLIVLENENHQDERMIRFLDKLGFTTKTLAMTYTRSPNVKG